ncbi:MAG: MATE family efflux transporter [Steroidobacteraceae bacterium]|jgi:MATE family multidrug resistance protein|nr:MATE family efflux transporter [Steroidobacteraceae bacterium]
MAPPLRAGASARAIGHRDVLDVALPMILANVTVPLVGIADAAAVGRLDDPASLAGVAVGATVFSLLFTALNFLRMGTTGLAAQAHGARDEAASLAILRQGLVVALGLSALLVLLATPLRIVAFALISPEPAALAEASDYFDTRLLGAPATLALFVLTGWFIGRGDGRSPLAIVLLVNGLNVVLDFAFVLGFGLAARGVALATVIAEYSGIALGLWLALRARRAAGAPARAAAPPWSQFLAVNLPLLLRTLALMLCFAFLTAMGARFGSAVLAANALLLNFLYLASYALDGFANAAESLIGRAVGARDGSMLRRALGLSAQWTLGVSLALSALFWLVGPLLVDLMTTQAPLRALAREYLPWLVAVPLVGGWAFLFDGVFVGATLTRQMRDTMLFAALAVYLPAWWVLQPLGNHGLWMAFLLFFAARGAAQAWVLWRLARRGGLLPALPIATQQSQ